MEDLEIERVNCRKKIHEKNNCTKGNMFFSDCCMDWSMIAKLIKWREDFL